MDDPTPFDTVIRGRRTDKRFTGVPVPRSLLGELCELATWAPTHRLTQPWRFAVFDRPALDRLAIWLPDSGLDAVHTAKLDKLMALLPEVGGLIYVTWERNADPIIDLEEHAAASAAVQNILLAATTRGLASFWSSSPICAAPAFQRYCGSDPEAEGFLAAVLLGPARDQRAAPPRLPLAQRLRWMDR